MVWIWAPVLLCPYSISASSTTHFHSHRVPWEVTEIHLYCQYEFLLYDEFSTVFCCFFFLLYIFFSICLFLAKAAMLTKAYEGNKGISIEGELWDLQNSVYWEKMCNGKKQSRALRVRGARAAHGISGELQELKPAINLASCPENTSPASYAFVWSIPTSVAMRWCYALNTGPANTYFAKNRHSLQRRYSLLNLPNVYWSSWPGLSPVCTSSCLLVAFL